MDDDTQLLKPIASVLLLSRVVTANELTILATVSETLALLTVREIFSVMEYLVRLVLCVVEEEHVLLLINA
jgi:hypothetical protein